MQNRTLLSLIVVAVLIGGAWYFGSSQVVKAPVASNNTVATSTASTTVSTPTTPTTPKTTTLAIDKKDTLTSWNFKGPYKDGGTLEAKTNTQIASLKTKMDENNPQVQEIYISIAKEYELLGDGKAAYDYYLRALNSSQRYEQEDALAWAGLAQLMTKLSAYYTAANAYTLAIAALPTEPSFHVARINFLMDYFPKDTAQIKAAFASADTYIPGNASIAQLRSEFEGSYSQ